MNNLSDKELLEQSQEFVKGVFERMTNIESLGSLKESVVAGAVGIVTSDGGVLSLDILSQNQLNQIKKCITESIESNMEEDRRFLCRLNLLSRKPATINQDFEDAVQEMVASNKNVSVDASDSLNSSENEKCEESIENDEIILKIENTASESDKFTQPETIEDSEQKKPKLDCSKENLQKIYIDQNKTVNEIVAEYDISSSTLYKELGRYGLVDLKKTKRKDEKYSGKRP